MRTLCNSFFVEKNIAVNKAHGSNILTNRMALPKEWHKGR